MAWSNHAKAITKRSCHGFVSLSLSDFPSVESGSLPAGIDTATDYRDKVFAMLQMAFGLQAVTNAQSFHEYTIEDYRKRPVERVQIEAYLINGVRVNVSGLQCKSLYERGQRTAWTFDINADLSDDKFLRERTLAVRNALVSFFHGIDKGMDILERENECAYISSDGN